MGPCGTSNKQMLSELYTDQRDHDYHGPSRDVRHPRACTVGGGTFAASQDGSRCVVAGKDVLRILRVADPPRNAAQAYDLTDPNGRLSTGSGGATIEAGVNLWFGSGLKMDSAPTDVVWARGTFDNKIVTSARNGEIIYWDINKPGSKYETRIKEHKRAVNKLAISPFLPYLFASGSQDGHIRIWDLRTPPSSSMKVYHATGIRALALCPVPSNPLMVCAGLESGNIQRWDIRNKASPLERITLAHSASILSMDWQLPSMKETGLGWLVTSAMDRHVKIWDLCLSPGTQMPANANDRDSMLRNKKMGPWPFRTLHMPFPVRNVCWRPGHDTEVAVVSNNESESETVEIWDIRRGWIGKWAIEGAEGGITDIAFAGSHALWAQHANGTFAQHDLRRSFRPLDAIPRVAISWSASGTLAFVANKQPAVEVPFDDVHPQNTALLQELRLRQKSTGDPIHVPFQQTLGVQDVPLFDPAAFARLAQSYIFDGDKQWICQTNAETASESGQYRAAQTWLLLLSQLTPLNESSPPPPVYSLPPVSRTEERTRASPAARSVTSHRAAVPSTAAAMPKFIETRPMETSPSSLFRSRTGPSTHGQETPLSSNSSSPRPKPATLPLQAESSARLLWPDTPTSRYDPLIPSSRVATASRRASTVLPVGPRLPRPVLRRASMSTPSVGSISPVSDGIKNRKHAHVGEGALDDSDSSSGSDDSGSRSSPMNKAVTQASSASPVARLVRSSKALPSPLSKLLVSREDSPDGHLASDERSLGEYDSDASLGVYDSDASHSPPSTSSPSSEPRSDSSPRKRSQRSRKAAGRRSRTPSVSPKPSGSANLSVSHRFLAKQESQGSIRTVTAAGSDPPSALLSSIGRLPSEADEEVRDGGPPTVPSSEGLSTRRPSPLHPRPAVGLALGLGLSNMEATRNTMDSGRGQPVWTVGGRLSELRKIEIQEDEARLREIAWIALREALEWFAERGDVQMCALLTLVAPKELRIGRLRAVRFVETYVDMLTRLQLHTLAARVRKYVVCDSVQDLAQVQTTLFSSCGQCRKPFKQKITIGSLLCQNCKSPPTLCAVCHLPVRTLLVHCAVCGHGGHQACFRQFYLARPMSEIPTRAVIRSSSAFSLSDSYSSTESGSTMYYSPSDGSEREGKGEDGGDEDLEHNGRVVPAKDKGRDEAHDNEYRDGIVNGGRRRMRVLGHACAAGCGHWCWAASERFGAA